MVEQYSSKMRRSPDCRIGAMDAKTKRVELYKSTSRCTTSRVPLRLKLLRNLARVSWKNPTSNRHLGSSVSGTCPSTSNSPFRRVRLQSSGKPRNVSNPPNWLCGLLQRPAHQKNDPPQATPN